MAKFCHITFCQGKENGLWLRDIMLTPLNYSLWLSCATTAEQNYSHTCTRRAIFFFVIYTAQFFSIQLKWKFYACSPSFFDISCYNFVWNCESVVEKVLKWKRGTPIWNMKCAFCSVAYSYFDKLKVQVIIFQSFLVGLHLVALQ